jgi:hypothetical protein
MLRTLIWWSFRQADLFSGLSLTDPWSSLKQTWSCDEPRIQNDKTSYFYTAFMQQARLAAVIKRLTPDLTCGGYGLRLGDLGWSWAISWRRSLPSWRVCGAAADAKGIRLAASASQTETPCKQLSMLRFGVPLYECWSSFDVETVWNVTNWWKISWWPDIMSMATT